MIFTILSAKLIKFSYFTNAEILHFLTCVILLIAFPYVFVLPVFHILFSAHPSWPWCCCIINANLTSTSIHLAQSSLRKLTFLLLMSCLKGFPACDVWRSQPWVLKILIRKDMETLSSKFSYFITDHKITESLRLAKNPRSSSPTFNQIPQCQLNHISKWHVYLFFWTLPWIVSSSFLWEACSNLLLFATKISISK